MNTPTQPRVRIGWPAAGFTIALVIGLVQIRPSVPFATGILGWCVALGLALVLPANPMGARAAAVLTGAGLALPCFIEALPLPRAFLACSMALPFIIAAALLRVPPIRGLRRRLGYVMTWRGTRPLIWCRPHLDRTALRNLVIATILFALCVAGVKFAGAWHMPRTARWLAGGLSILAFAEMMSSALPLVTRGFGVVFPPLMLSPHLSRSLGDFWTKHWNIGASVLFREHCFRPLARHSARRARVITFGISGLAHAMLAQFALQRWELSLMCGAFFLIQPLFIECERWLKVRRWPSAAARVWTLGVLTATSPLFVEPALRVIEPSWGPPEQVIQPTLVPLAMLLVVSLLIALLAAVAEPPPGLGIRESRAASRI